MFAVITCSHCGNNRIVDLSVGRSTCPFCGNKNDVGNMVIKFKHNNPDVVRDFLQGKDLEATSNDPMSKLKYEVDHCRDVAEKMAIISEGLVKIKGEFTLEDIESLVPGKGEKYLSTMLENCMIYEVAYGRYRI